MEFAFKLVAAIVGVYLSAVCLSVAIDHTPSFVWQLLYIFAWFTALLTFLWLFMKKTSDS